MSSQFVTITVLNGILRRQDTALAQRLVTDITVFSIHAVHDDSHLIGRHTTVNLAASRFRARSQARYFGAFPPFTDRTVVS